MDIAELGVLTGWFKSKSAVRREIKNGGFRINEYRLTDPFCEVFYSKSINHIVLLETDNGRKVANFISPPSKVVDGWPEIECEIPEYNGPTLGELNGE